jgi:hypothetical protein
MVVVLLAAAVLLAWRRPAAGQLPPPVVKERATDVTRHGPVIRASAITPPRLSRAVARARFSGLGGGAMLTSADEESVADRAPR